MGKPTNLHEYEVLARKRLPPMAFNYYAGGANDEFTVDDNLREWQRIRLLPRVLVNVDQIDIRTTVLGQALSMPVMIAPCGCNMLAHPEGECAVARAAAAEQIVQVASTVASYTLEEIAAASSGQRWFQLYCYRDRAVTRDLVQRAEAAGYSALCLTVDVPCLGRRERDVRDSFYPPNGLSLRNLERYALDKPACAPGNSSLAKYASEQWDSSLTWDIIPWLRSIMHMPIVLKGVLAPADAKLAIEQGVAGIIVSNHGGRQLDTTIGTTEALREIVDQAAGQIDILVDGGIRRGTDVVKAIALGAKAALIGRPYLWGLAVDGEAGVRHVLQLLRDEIILAMALVGRTTLKDLDRTLLRFGSR